MQTIFAHRRDDSGWGRRVLASNERNERNEREKICSFRAWTEIAWVAQATGLCRPATRRTEWGAHRQRIRTAFCWAQPCSFRSAGRRPARAGRPCYPFFKHALRAWPEIAWVAQATGLCRPATRRTEWGGRRQRMTTTYCAVQPCSFRSAGRRPARAGRPCYPFFKHALRAWPEIAWV